MAPISPTPPGVLVSPNGESSVSWSAILAGGTAAAVLSFVLLTLGSALGLSMLSPWQMFSGNFTDAESVKSFTAKAAIWLIVMQWLSSALGGYFTGRLRKRWTGLRSDETLFRDTAHGFLAWAVATLLTVTLLVSSAGMVIGGTVKTAAMAAPPPPRMEAVNDPNAYFVDMLFRSPTRAEGPLQDSRAETLRILANGFKNEGVTADDQAYLTRLVAARTGLSATEASARVDTTLADLDAAREKLKQNAETARKAAMHFSLFMFLSLLVGAFIASAAAAIGGRQRDEI